MRNVPALLLLLPLVLSACHHAPPPQAAPPEQPPIQALGVENAKNGDLLAHARLIRHFSADDMTGVISQANVSADAAVSSDGHGSLKISVVTPDTKTIPLYEVSEPLPASGGNFIYRIKLRTDKNFSGQAFVELSARFSDNGDFLPRSIANGIQGGSNGQWVTLTSPFYMHPDDAAPKALLISLTLTGPATVWVDDVDLLQSSGH